LPILLPAKSLTINTCHRVTDFPDLHINLAFPVGSFYTASEAPRDENQQYVATCCRCVAGGKGQRNPCKMGFVAVLPIFRTSIYQYDLSGDF
jgi:ABC-type uncharacterized transport system permease subunit